MNKKLTPKHHREKRIKSRAEGLWNKRLTPILSKPFIRLVRGSAVFFFGRITGAVAAFAMQILLARWLGGEALGIYVRAFSWCVILSILSTLGLGYAAIRFIGMNLATKDQDQIHGYVRRSWQLVFATSCLVCCLVFAVVMLKGDSISAAERGALQVAFLCIPVFSLMHLSGSIAKALSWFPLAVVPSTVMRPTLLLLLFSIAWFYGVASSATDVMLINLGVMLILTVGQALLLRQRLRKQLTGSMPEYDTPVWIRTGIPLLVSALFIGYFPELNVIFAGMFLPAEDLAVLSAGFRISMLITFVMSAVDSATTPSASRIYSGGDRTGMQRLVSSATQLRFWSALVAAGLLALFGKKFLGLFGPDFIAGYGVLLALTLAQVFRAACGPVAELLNVTGHQDQCLKVFAWSLVLIALLNIVLIPVYGIDGTAIAVLVTIGVSTLWLHQLVVKHLGIHPSILSAMFSRLRHR